MTPAQAFRQQTDCAADRTDYHAIRPLGPPLGKRRTQNKPEDRLPTCPPPPNRAAGPPIGPNIRHTCGPPNTRTGCKSSGCRTGSQRLWSNKPRAGRTASAYHATGSFRITPSIASSAVNVPARYCTQSITSGSSPLLRTERFPAGATRTTLPSATGKTVPST